MILFLPAYQPVSHAGASWKRPTRKSISGRTREAFADYVPWLMLVRPAAIDILVHPLTRSQALDRQMLEAEDASLLASSAASKNPYPPS